MLSTKELMICGVFGALSLVLSFVVGGAIIMATGIPGTGGIVNLLIIGFLVIICAKIVDKFGAITLTLIVFSIVAIPTVILSPPGIHKIVIGIAWGLTWDILFIGLKRYGVFGNMISSGLAAFVGGMGMYFSVVLLGLPGEEQMRAAVIPLLSVAMIGAAIGTYFGVRTYDKKLKHISIVQNLKSYK